MSKSQAIAFFEEISRNKQLAKEIEKVVGEKTSDEAKSKKLISLANKHGFNFTQDEAAAAQVELKKSLSAKDMLEVSGGDAVKSSVMAMALLACLGGGVSTLPTIETSAMKPHYQSQSTKEPTNHKQLGIDSVFARNIIENLNAQNQGETRSAFSPITNLDHFQILSGSQEQDGNPFSEPKTNSDPNGAFAVSRTSEFITYEDSSSSQVSPEFLKAYFKSMSPMIKTQQESTREIPGPKPPADRYEQHVVEQRTSLTKEEVKKLAKKYRCDTRPKFAQSWVNNVVEKVAAGLRPDFSIHLTEGSHDDFREKCAYCGSGGSVNISYEGENGKYHHIKCGNSGCPMNWVCNDGERIGDEKTPSLAPWKYEVRRWGKLPQLIADIEALLSPR